MTYFFFNHGEVTIIILLDAINFALSLSGYSSDVDTSPKGEFCHAFLSSSAAIPHPLH